MPPTRTHVSPRERKPQAPQRKVNSPSGKSTARGAPLAQRATPEQRRAPMGSQLGTEMPRGPQPEMDASARQVGVMTASIFTVGFDGQIYTTWWGLGANNAAGNAWYGVGGFVAQESAVDSIARFAVAEASA